MQALVSVIVPVYNTRPFLRQCLESIVAQTHDNLEILLIDDGSTDGSGTVCDRWTESDKRIRMIHQENAGAGLARNRGLDAASGQYVLFVDSDDYIAPETVALCVAKSEETNAGVVLFGRCEVGLDGSIRRQKVPAGLTEFDRGQVRNDLLPGLFTYDRGFGVGVGGKMFDLRLLRRGRARFPSEREVASEDACFMLAAFAGISAAAVVPEGLYFYRNNPASLSRAYRAGQQDRNDAFLRRSLALCEAAGYPPKTADHIRARYHTLSLVGMKQIVGADMPEAEKRAALAAVFSNPLLRSSITEPVLALDIPKARIFWRAYRREWFALCRGMLLCKVHLQNIRMEKQT